MAKAPATVPGSLPEGAVERSETEGVSPDGCSMPTFFPQALIYSEVFDRLQTSKYTPITSIPRPLDVVSAGGGFLWVLCVWGIFSIQPGACETVGLRAIFIAPTKLRNRFPLPFNGRHSLREGAGNGWFHSTGYSLKSGGTGDFHRPYESDILPFHVGERFVLQSGGGYGIIWGREKILSNQIRSYANGNSE